MTGIVQQLRVRAMARLALKRPTKQDREDAALDHAAANRLSNLAYTVGYCAERFREYEEHHEAKANAMEPVGRITPERDAVLKKAERNREIAEMCEAIIKENG